MEAAMSAILVAYATKHGSTREVAEAIGAVAMAEGAEVEVAPAHAVAGPVSRVDLVVLGAPIYSGRWHRDAHRFLKRHRRELAGLPVAVFALGPRRADEEAWQHSWAQLHRALAKRAWLHPVAVGLFGGADPAGQGRATRRDLRDWTAIGDWTRKALVSARGGQSL
jgi:menaquinone-dependent protoporphyrinogen oxidase